MERAKETDRPSNDQRTADRRQAEDVHYSGDERRKGERRKKEI